MLRCAASSLHPRFMPLWAGQPLAYPTVQKTGAAAVLVTERRQTRHVLVADIESLGPELVEGSTHVDRVPQDDGVDDQAKGAELILLALAVALAQFTALAVEDNAGELVTALAAVELVEDTAAVGFVVDVGQQVERLDDAGELFQRPR